MSLKVRRGKLILSEAKSLPSRAGAAFLIRDGLIPGDNIHIFEELKVTGGSLDGAGSTDQGYVIRGGRMMEEHHVCTYDLFASIPSLTKGLSTGI